ncbi:hypothetical protein ACQGRZ_28020 [Bacillus wiedmannii]|uniref:hypothetical protein n=1 Tax=Bacillus wiedmannii TaxID=1890302 RepID=UPI003CEC8E9A
MAEKIKQFGWGDVEIITDSSEPKSIDEMKNDHGIKKIKGAVKEPVSVEYREKWLDNLEKIIIDPNRCPKTAGKFKNIDWETDKDDNSKTDYKIRIIIVLI